MLSGSGSTKFSCLFCEGNNHSSNIYTKVTDPKNWKLCIFQKSLCYICLSPKHKAMNCKNNYLCKKCNGRHNIAICQKDLQKPPLGNNQQQPIVPNTPVTNSASPSSFQNLQVPVAEQQVNIASNYSGNSLNNISLQTAEATTLNLNQNNTAKSFILFDSGAQRTYITKVVKENLNLALFKQENITTKVFCRKELKVQIIDAVKFIVIGARKNVYDEALVIPTICSNLYGRYSNSAISNNYPHLKNLKLAQESNETCVKVDILVRLDYYQYYYYCINIILLYCINIIIINIIYIYIYY